MESPDIRAGMAMLIAALCADGVTEIGNVRQIDRGYERIDERLRELGARIDAAEDDVPVAGRDATRSGRAAATQSRAMVDRIPSGTRDVLPDEMRELRAMTDRDPRGVRAAPATARSTRRRSSTSGTFDRADMARAAGPRTGCSTSRATCSCCART